MNEPIRRLSVVSLVMFLALMMASSFIQVLGADELNNDPRNVRTLYREFGDFRGPIIVDGDAVVYSRPVNSPFSYQRTYTDAQLYSHAVGFYSIVYGRSGIEQTNNQLLSGSADALFWSRLSDLFAGREQEGASVELTLSQAMQQAAVDAMGSQHGAVVAIDPRSGEVLALVSLPSFDAARLASHDTASVNEYYRELLDDPDQPLANRALAGDTYPPGSVFKLVVAAAALEAGYTPDSELYAPRELSLPQTSTTIRNYEGGSCSADDHTSLLDALRISCNTAFADLGMALGWGAIAREAQDFGWGQSYEIPQRVAASRLPQAPDAAQTAMSSLGQFDVRATPLQLAMLAAGIGNDGVLMEPYLVKAVRASDLTVIEEAQPRALGTAVSAQTAAYLQQMMVAVVEQGTGRSARIDGVRVAGKTGTAETGVGGPPHALFVGFAPADNPVIAIAVVVEHGGDAGSEATGGRVAAPIARAVIEAALAREEGRS